MGRVTTAGQSATASLRTREGMRLQSLRSEQFLRPREKNGQRSGKRLIQSEEGREMYKNGTGFENSVQLVLE